MTGRLPSAGGTTGLLEAHPLDETQTLAQAFGKAGYYTGIVTYLILKAIDLVMGLRVNEEQETIGLDLSLHNERGYNL